MAYAGFLRTLPAPASTLGGFVCLLDTTWFTQADSNALDGTTFINGGGSLRLYTDATKATQLPVDVVSFVAGGTPEVKVFTRLPSYASGETIWVESDATATSQPVSTSTYGSEAVWQDYEAATRDGSLDITGNTSFSPSNVSVGADRQGMPSLSFNGSNSRADAAVSTLPYPFAIQGWINGNAYSDTIFGVADASETNRFHRLASTGNNKILVQSNDGSMKSTATRTVSQNQWYFVHAVYDSASSRTLIVDGVVHSTNSSTVSAINIDRFTVGTDADSTPFSWFNGEIQLPALRSSGVSGDLAASEYANQNSPSTFGSSSGWVTGGGGGESISSDTSLQSVSVSEPILTQDFISTIQELQSFSTLSNVVLLSGQEVSVNSLSQSNQLDESNISQNHNVSVNDLSSSSSITEPSILQSAALLVDSLICSSSLDEANLAVSSTLLLEDLRSQSALDGANLSQANVLSVESLGSSISLEQASLTLAGVLASSSLTSSVKLGSIDLTQDSSLVIDSIASASLLGNAVVQEASQLILDNLSSGTLLGNVSISAGDVLSVESIESINKLDNLDLTQETFLLVDSVSSSQSLGYVFFGVTPELEAYTITFSQSSDQVSYDVDLIKIKFGE